jgi:two-component system, chemotaxis family, protein-glutamate methylesterase/glutaminase
MIVAPEPDPVGRDVIVIGASMGGIEALSLVLGQLPAELPASVFVVLHTADQGPYLLAEVLGKELAAGAARGGGATLRARPGLPRAARPASAGRC